MTAVNLPGRRSFTARRSATRAGATVATASVRRRPSGGRLVWLRHLVAVAICLVMIFPIYWMFVTAVQPEADLLNGVGGLIPKHLDFGNFTAALRAQQWGRWFLNTLVVAAISVVLTVSLCLLAGYAFAKVKFFGRGLLFVLILSTLIMPVQVIIVPQFRIVVDLHIFDSLWGVILPGVADAFSIFLARQYMMSIPNELLEAARVDGAGPFMTFYRAVLPLCKPLVAVLVLFNVAYRWTDFGWPLIVLKSPSHYTVTVGLLYLQGEYTQNYAQLLGMALLTILPMLLLFAFLQRYFVQGLLRSGIR